MKTKFVCFLMIAFSISAYCQQKSPNIKGTWKLVQYQTINGNSVINEFPGKSVMDMTKIWTDTHFMAVGRTKIDTTVSDGYALGTYKLEGNRYEEDVKILFYKPWEGKKIKMLLDLKNDTLIQTYPVDDKGKMDKDWAWIEKYVRVK
jgi:hypothetical protein